MPGIGAQGGDLDATLAAGLDARGAGLLINSSRGIIYAGGGAADAIRAAAAELRAAINRQRDAAPRERGGRLADASFRNALLMVPPSTRSAAPLVADDNGLAT